jgi:signal transduction histidine kinase
MRKSIYIKLVLIFIGLFVLGNSFAFYIVASFYGNQIDEGVRNQNYQFIMDNKAAYESGKMAESDIETLQRYSILQIRFFDSEQEIEDQYGIGSASLAAVSDTPVSIESEKRKTMVYIVRTGSKYIVAQPKVFGVYVSIRDMLLNAILVALGIGIVVMLIAGWFLVRPVKKLIQATELIASGDFDVHIPEKRKDELGKLVKNFNTMAAELKGMEMMRSGFISDISHEFRTPLTSIEGYAKLLRGPLSDEEKNEYIDTIVGETKRLATLTSSILTLSKIENENISIIKEKFRLDEQVRKMLLTFEAKWQDKDIDLQLSLDSVSYTGDQQLLYQVWSNLFDNAVKFSDRGGAVEIGLTERESKVVFAITDYGRGLSEEEQKRMFEKFYTGDPSRNTEGNGLGLSIVKRIVELHGGRIEVQSRLGEYTTIRVIL